MGAAISCTQTENQGTFRLTVGKRNVTTKDGLSAEADSLSFALRGAGRSRGPLNGGSKGTSVGA